MIRHVYSAARHMYGIWLAMVTTIAKRCGAELSPATAAKLVTAALAGVAAYTTGSKILSWGVIAVAGAVPGAALPAAMAMNAGLNAYLTRRLGMRCITRFARGLVIGSAGTRLSEPTGSSTP